MQNCKTKLHQGLERKGRQQKKKREKKSDTKANNCLTQTYMTDNVDGETDVLQWKPHFALHFKLTFVFVLGD